MSPLVGAVNLIGTSARRAPPGLFYAGRRWEGTRTVASWKALWSKALMMVSQSAARHQIDHGTHRHGPDRRSSTARRIARRHFVPGRDGFERGARGGTPAWHLTLPGSPPAAGPTPRYADSPARSCAR